MKINDKQDLKEDEDRTSDLAKGRTQVMAKAASEGTTKGMVADHISQAVLSTSNLLHLMQQSSPTQGLVKLPKNLLAKTPNIKNTEQVLDQMPLVISALDAHLDRALQCASELHTIRCLLMKKDSALAPLSMPSEEQPVSQT